MSMTIEEARAIKRDPIKIGETYTFYSEVESTTVADCSPVSRKGLGLIDLPGLEANETDKTPLRTFTGREVEVIRRLEVPAEADEECSPSYVVEVIGTKTRFQAHEEELNGWDLDLGQFYGPAGIWGSVE